MRFPDADENLRRARAMIESAHAADRAASVEIYHRESLRRRVGIAARGRAPEILEAMEEGIAIRVRSDAVGAPERIGFAASTGAETALPWVLDRALANARPSSDPLPLWAPGGPPLLDREVLEAPSLEDLLAWLPGMGGCWVEAGVTVETLAADDGLLASRARTRAWAMMLVQSTPGGHEQPRTSYGRTLASLDLGWRSVEDEPGPETSRGTPDPSDPVLFVGEAARVLVLALVAAFHGEGAPPGLPVGRGWSLRNDPLHPGAVAGGSFDDAGFPSQSLLLADGHSTLGRIEGPGHLIRPSYRDRPAALATCLTIFGENAPLPESATHIVDLRVHAPEPATWIVEGDGHRVRGGIPQGSFRGALARTTPGELVRRVVGTAGPLRSFGTVVTPALVVEGLRFES